MLSLHASSCWVTAKNWPVITPGMQNHWRCCSSSALIPVVYVCLWSGARGVNKGWLDSVYLGYTAKAEMDGKRWNIQCVSKKTNQSRMKHNLYRLDYRSFSGGEQNNNKTDRCGVVEAKLHIERTVWLVGEKSEFCSHHWFFFVGFSTAAFCTAAINKLLTA